MDGVSVEMFVRGLIIMQFFNLSYHSLESKAE